MPLVVHLCGSLLCHSDNQGFNIAVDTINTYIEQAFVYRA